MFALAACGGTPPAPTESGDTSPVDGGQATASYADSRASTLRADELADLAYLVGEWEVVSMYRQESGEFEAAPLTTSFRARLTFDGWALTEEFYDPKHDSFYSLRVITWDPEAGEVIGSLFNARRNRRVEFRGPAVDGTLLLGNRGGYGKKNDDWYRERDVVVNPDTVERWIEHSENGVDWVEGDYYSVLRRRAAE